MSALDKGLDPESTATLRQNSDLAKNLYTHTRPLKHTRKCMHTQTDRQKK